MLAPGVTMPGEAMPVTVELTANKQIPVDAVDVSLTGLDIYYVHSHASSNKSHPYEILRAQQRVSSGGQLAMGTTRFDCSFDLPEDAPPSFHGVKAIVHYLVGVHVDIPWWPDARSEFEVNVGWPPRPDVEAEPRTYASAHGHFMGARAVVKLAREVGTTGATLEAALTLEELPPNQPLSGVRVSLVAQESGPLNRTAQVHSDVAYVFHCLEVPIDALADGSEVPLSVPIPRHIPPSFRSHRWALSWTLRMEAMITWGLPVVYDVPLTLFPPERAGGAGSGKVVRLEPGRTPRAVPTVVTEGGQRIWQSAATRSGFFFDGQALHGRAGGAAITITSELDRDNARLLCRLTFPPLNLDLNVRPARGLEQLGGGLSIGVAPWDERFRVSARDALQVTALLRGARKQGKPLNTQLLRATRAEMDDDQIRINWRGSGLDEVRLVEAVEHARAVALELHEARQQIPPPRGMQEMVPAWRETARQLNATLETSHMAIRGQLHGFPFVVRTEWTSGEPLRTVLELASPEGPEPVHQLHLDVQQTDEDPRPLDDLPSSARTMARALLDGALRLVLSPGAVRVDMDAPMEDPALASERLGQMMSLLAALTSRDGPYR